jgi:hypothetical protein
MIGFLRRAATLPILALAGCGGGGGNDSKSTGDTLAAANAGFAAGATGTETLILEQTMLTATFPSGTSFPIVVRGTENPPTRATRFVRIAQDREQLIRSISISRVSDTTLDLNLITTSSISPGTHTGTFQVIVCVDPGCTKPFANSPMTLSYDFEVTPPNKFSSVPAMIIASQTAGQSAEVVVTLIPSQPLGAPLHFRLSDTTDMVPNSGSFVLEGTSIQAKFKFSPTLAPGRYERYAPFSVCYDPQCSMHVSGSSINVPYSLTVSP